MGRVLISNVNIYWCRLNYTLLDWLNFNRKSLVVVVLVESHVHVLVALGSQVGDLEQESSVVVLLSHDVLGGCCHEHLVVVLSSEAHVCDLLSVHLKLSVELSILVESQDVVSSVHGNINIIIHISGQTVSDVLLLLAILVEVDEDLLVGY